MEGCTKKDVEVWYFAIWGGWGGKKLLKNYQKPGTFFVRGGYGRRLYFFHFYEHFVSKS